MPEARQQILVVEDDPLVFRAMERILTRGDFEVHHAANVTAAREIITQLLVQGSPDVILTDWMMPEAKGGHKIEGGAQVVQLAREHRIPHVVITGTGSTPTMKDLGINDFLQKPVLPPNLLETIRAKLTRRMLVVEDNLNAQRTLVAMLKADQPDLEIDATDNLEEAKELMRRWREQLHIVLSDWSIAADKDPNSYERAGLGGESVLTFAHEQGIPHLMAMSGGLNEEAIGESVTRVVRASGLKGSRIFRKPVYSEGLLREVRKALED